MGVLGFFDSLYFNPHPERIYKGETMRRYNPFFLLVGVVFLAGTGCATTKKSPCKPHRKTINCFQFEDRECGDKLNQFANDFIERFNRTRIKFDQLTVHTEYSGSEETYNLKLHMDLDSKFIYVTVTHCIQGVVVDKKRVPLGIEYD